MAKKTALFEVHQKHHATMTEFAGWDMPLHYGSQVEEHKTVRTKAGIFDVSHMRSVDIEGNDSKAFLRKLLANDVGKLNIKQALYTVMLDENAGIIDDLIVYYLSDTHYRCVVNAATTQKDLAWMDNQASNLDVKITPRDDLAMLAIQGPQAFQRLQEAFTDGVGKVIPQLKRFYSEMVNDWLVAYTGYTGEQGVEIILPKEQAAECFEQCVQAGIAPIGLGARDTLRLEAGLNLYGQDMDESQNPYSSNLGWTVDLNDTERSFIGKNALEQIKAAGSPEKLVALVLEDKGVIRPGMKVLDQDHNDIGVITSGSFSPIAQKGIGLARVSNPDTTTFFISLRGKPSQAKKIKLPFVKAGKTNF